MTFSLLDGQTEYITAVPICVTDGWGNPVRCKKCYRCGNEFDLRRANADEWICGECVAIYRGGQAALDAYIESHPRHYLPCERCGIPTSIGKCALCRMRPEEAQL